jgi:hypothetical protein
VPSHALVIPKPNEVDLNDIPSIAREVEAWANRVDDLDVLENWRAGLGALEGFLRRKHDAAAADIARAARKLELRVSELLPPAEMGRPRSNSKTSLASEVSVIPKDDRYKLRKMGAHRDEPAVIDAIERGASQREVLRTIDRVKADKVVDTAKQWFNENIPPPTDPEGDKFRARVWESIFALQDAAEAMGKWTVDDVRRAITTEKLKHVRKQMADGIVDALDALDPYRECVP